MADADDAEAGLDARLERMGRSLEATKKLSARALAKFGEILGRNGA